MLSVKNIDSNENWVTSMEIKVYEWEIIVTIQILWEDRILKIMINLRVKYVFGPSNFSEI